MQELGGQFRYTSTPGRGTCVRCVLPVDSWSGATTDPIQLDVVDAAL